MDIIMKSIKPITAVLSILLLTGCASTTTVKLKPTDTIRKTTTAKSDTTRIHVSQQPGADNPKLGITVVRQVRQKQSFERRHVERQSLKLSARILLWLSGTTLSAGGYLFLYQQGYVVLGRDLMGLGAMIPLGCEILTGSVELGEQWKPESKTLPTRSVPARAIPLLVVAADSTWEDTTDSRGVVAVDISGLADISPPGQPLKIRVALQEDTTQAAAFTIPPDMVAFYRPPSQPARPSIAVETDEDDVAEDIVIKDTELESFEWEPPPPLPVTVETEAAPPRETTAVESRPTIAILDFEGLGISEQEAKVLTNRLGTHMVQLGRYQVIERGQMQQILVEQDFQLTGCTSDECAVEIGQLLGVQQMLAGSFGRSGSIYTIDMRIIDVATGGILRTTSYDVQGEAELLLTEGLAEAAKRIAGVD